MSKRPISPRTPSKFGSIVKIAKGWFISFFTDYNSLKPFRMKYVCWISTINECLGSPGKYGFFTSSHESIDTENENWWLWNEQDDIPISLWSLGPLKLYAARPGEGIEKLEWVMKVASSWWTINLHEITRSTWSFSHLLCWNYCCTSRLYWTVYKEGGPRQTLSLFDIPQLYCLVSGYKSDAVEDSIRCR